LQTRRWRKGDSNRWSHLRRRRSSEYLISPPDLHTVRSQVRSGPRGIDGSNPLSSSEESGANCASAVIDVAIHWTPQSRLITRHKVASHPTSRLPVVSDPHVPKLSVYQHTGPMAWNSVNPKRPIRNDFMARPSRQRTLWLSNGLSNETDNDNQRADRRQKHPAQKTIPLNKVIG
jgi:hypothetical protein